MEEDGDPNIWRLDTVVSWFTGGVTSHHNQHRQRIWVHRLARITPALTHPLSRIAEGTCPQQRTQSHLSLLSFPVLRSAKSPGSPIHLYTKPSPKFRKCPEPLVEWLSTDHKVPLSSLWSNVRALILRYDAQHYARIRSKIITCTSMNIIMSCIFRYI